MGRVQINNSCEVSKGILSQRRGAPHLTVGKNVTLKASSFNKAQQLSTNGGQWIQYQSLKNLEISITLNAAWNLVRDQGAEVQILSDHLFQ
jgi:hypothetical protein